ncbi:MAG: YraN family protein [bacterium]|nr:YraN family protein [bacterium]
MSESKPPNSRPDPRRALGALGEARAAEYLEAEGYRILARNERAGGVELDLVVARGPLLAFVEVKTRRSLRYGRPEEAVDEAKQARLRRGALAWMREHHRRGRMRFDVVAVSAGPGDDWIVHHLPGAFDGGGC